MTPELLTHLRALTRFTYFVTDEEDRFLVRLNTMLKAKYDQHTWVFNAALGLVPLPQLIADWNTGAHQQNPECSNIHDTLIHIYKTNPKEDVDFYVITDPDHWLRDPHVQRRVLNLAHQSFANDRVIKLVIFVGSRLMVPPKLQRYIDVVFDDGLSDKDIMKLLHQGDNRLPAELKEGEPPPELVPHFRGLTSFEVRNAISQSIIKTQDDEVDRHSINPNIVAKFKRQKLNKTGLLSYVNTDGYTFDVLGGADRFKAWIERYKAAWTTEGQAFGLKPPKGVLSVGVWGCGKSLGVKVMGNAWGLPVVTLEMGKLRSSAVGETEANVYQATKLIESVAPCLIWLDEAEKSLAGAQSSSQSDAGTTSRALGILSTWLQETNAQVCLAMTANTLKTLPVEFVSRMTEKFFFDMPSHEERITIIKIHLKKQQQDPEAIDDGEPRYQLAELAEASKHMVGREIEQAIQAAMVESFHQGLKHLDHEVLLAEMSGKPRIYKTMVDELREVLEWVGWDEDQQDGIRARLASGKRSEVFSQFRVSGKGT